MKQIDEIKKRIINILTEEGFFVNDMDINGNNIYTDETNTYSFIFDEVE